jgi:hypothetical protein
MNEASYKGCITRAGEGQEGLGERGREKVSEREKNTGRCVIRPRRGRDKREREREENPRCPACESWPIRINKLI